MVPQQVCEELFHNEQRLRTLNHLVLLLIPQRVCEDLLYNEQRLRSQDPGSSSSPGFLDILVILCVLDILVLLCVLDILVLLCILQLLLPQMCTKLLCNEGRLFTHLVLLLLQRGDGELSAKSSFFHL